MNSLSKLLGEEIKENEKYKILLESIKVLRKAETLLSYSTLIEKIIPVIEKNVCAFETNKCFQKEELEQYVKIYEQFWQEYRKYQVWLVGTAEDCQTVKAVLDYNKVHLLGIIGQGGGNFEECDYIIICSGIGEEQLKKYEPHKVIRYDFMRFCQYRISPETAYLEFKIHKQLNDKAEGAVTGLSYEQRGIDFDKVGRNLVCLAAPSQDLYLDFKNFIWLYDEVVYKRKGNIKYCVIGMDFYRLWYDLSLSEGKIRMLCFYRRLRAVHHFHDFDSLLLRTEEDYKICEELMTDDYMEKDYINSFHPENYFGEIHDQYEMTEEAYQRDSEEVKKVFHKPYPYTFQENKDILDKFLKFLHMHNIKTLIYIPPFPRIFNEFTSEQMKKETENVIAEFKEKYEFGYLDLSNHELFTDEYFADWCHLNQKGAVAATNILNEFMDKIWE